MHTHTRLLCGSQGSVLSLISVAVGVGDRSSVVIHTNGSAFVSCFLNKYSRVRSFHHPGPRRVLSGIPSGPGGVEEPDPPVIISWSEPGHTAVQHAHGRVKMKCKYTEEYATVFPLPCLSMLPGCRLLSLSFVFTASFFSASLPLCLLVFLGGNEWKAEFKGLPRVHTEQRPRQNMT